MISRLGWTPYHVEATSPAGGSPPQAVPRLHLPPVIHQGVSRISPTSLWKGPLSPSPKLGCRQYTPGELQHE